MIKSKIPTFKENVNAFVLKAAKTLKLKDDLINHIRSTHSVIQVNVELKLKIKLKILLVGAQFIVSTDCLLKEVFVILPMLIRMKQKLLLL